MRQKAGDVEMNETMAQISDLAFEAALAGYVVALVCYAIELASRRGADSEVRETAGAAMRSAERGATSTITRSGNGSGGSFSGKGTAAIGLIAATPVASWASGSVAPVSW